MFLAVVWIIADCGIIGNDTTQASAVFYCVEVGAIDADLRGTSLFMEKAAGKTLQANDNAEFRGCIREAVDDVL